MGGWVGGWTTDLWELLHHVRDQGVRLIEEAVGKGGELSGVGGDSSKGFFVFGAFPKVLEDSGDVETMLELVVETYRWVGGWVDDWVEEEQAVRMRCCTSYMGG